MGTDFNKGSNDTYNKPQQNPNQKPIAKEDETAVKTNEMGDKNQPQSPKK